MEIARDVRGKGEGGGAHHERKIERGREREGKGGGGGFSVRERERESEMVIAKAGLCEIESFRLTAVKSSPDAWAPEVHSPQLTPPCVCVCVCV